VLDPETLFSEPGYLMDVAIGYDDEDEDGPPWRLLLLEDCDELIRSQAGQPLSRPAQPHGRHARPGPEGAGGHHHHEDLRQLHPAVVRPGRCLAHIEIGPLAPAVGEHPARPAGSHAAHAGRALRAAERSGRGHPRGNPAPGSTCKNGVCSSQWVSSACSPKISTPESRPGRRRVRRSSRRGGRGADRHIGFGVAWFYGDA